jgi:hypothetical protein
MAFDRAPTELAVGLVADPGALRRSRHYGRVQRLGWRPIRPGQTKLQTSGSGSPVRHCTGRWRLGRPNQVMRLTAATRILCDTPHTYLSEAQMYAPKRRA